MGSAHDKIIRVDREIELLTGEGPYMYTSQPGDGQTKVVFQGHQCASYAEGLAYIEGLRADAYRAYAEQAGPFDKASTEYVSTWICNDGDYYEAARTLALGKDLAGLAEYVTNVLDAAREGSAAWHTRRELSANDMLRIEWLEVATDLIGD